MNKKILSVMGAIFLVCSVNAFSWGIGIQGGADPFGTSGEASVTFKLDSTDLIFGVAIPSFAPFALGVTADYWFLNENIAGPLNWYLGAGLFGSIFIGNNAGAVTFGARAPIGLNMFIADVVEPYLQIAPGCALTVTNGVIPRFTMPINLGVRFWFNK